MAIITLIAVVYATSLVKQQPQYIFNLVHGRNRLFFFLVFLIFFFLMKISLVLFLCISIFSVFFFAIEANIFLISKHVRNLIME